jgi:hypothetical protein
MATRTLASLTLTAALALDGSVHAQAAQKVQPPTATEYFKLQGECAKLGQKKLDLVNHNNGAAWTNNMRSRYGSDDTGRCYVAISSYLPKNNPYTAKEEADWYLYDGQNDHLLAVAAKLNSKPMWGDISDPEYHGTPPKTVFTDPNAANVIYQWAYDYIASKVGKP